MSNLHTSVSQPASQAHTFNPLLIISPLLIPYCMHCLGLGSMGSTLYTCNVHDVHKMVGLLCTVGSTSRNSAICTAFSTTPLNDKHALGLGGGGNIRYCITCSTCIA